MRNHTHYIIAILTEAPVILHNDYLSIRAHARVEAVNILHAPDGIVLPLGEAFHKVTLPYRSVEGGHIHICCTLGDCEGDCNVFCEVVVVLVVLYFKGLLLILYG